MDLSSGLLGAMWLPERGLETAVASMDCSSEVGHIVLGQRAKADAILQQGRMTTWFPRSERKSEEALSPLCLGGGWCHHLPPW